MPRALTPLSRPVRALWAIVLVSLFCFLLSGCSTVTIGEEEPEIPVGQIVPSRLAIVHTGALMGHFMDEEGTFGLPMLVGYAHKLEEDGYDVLLLDSGETLQGTNLVDLSNGESAIGLLNIAGYDSIALGGAELSLSQRMLDTRISQSDFPFLSANATNSEGQTLANPYATFTLSDGRMVGIFGLTSPGALDAVPPFRSDEIRVDGETLIETAQQQVAELRKAGCKLVVCLTNFDAYAQGAAMGTDMAPDSGSASPQDAAANQAQPADGTEQGITNERPVDAVTLAGSVSGIDVILDAGGTQAHHESCTDASGTEETLVVHTPGKMEGASAVFWEQGVLSAQEVSTTEDVTPDEQSEAFLTQTIQEQDTWLADPIATATKSLPNDAAMRSECALGNLVADALLWEGRHAGARIAPDAALVDAGSLYDSLPAGSITRKNAFAVCPHNETRLCTILVTGQQLDDVFEEALTGTGAAYPQVAGMTLELYDQPDAEQGRVRIKTVGTQGYAKDAHYVLVVTEHVAEGVGPYRQLITETSSLTSLDTDGGTALIDYLNRVCHGEVPPTYDKAEGRIKTVKPQKEGDTP